MAAGAAVHRADVEARATADAGERLTPDRVGEHAGQRMVATELDVAERVSRDAHEGPQRGPREGKRIGVATPTRLQMGHRRLDDIGVLFLAL